MQSDHDTFNYFKKVEHTISESAQASGLKKVEEN